MAKGFTVPAELRAERYAIDSNPSPDLDNDETNDKFAWAVAHKPGANPVNGGIRRWHTNRQASSARIILARARRRNPRVKLGRYTPSKRAQRSAVALEPTLKRLSNLIRNVSGQSDGES